MACEIETEFLGLALGPCGLPATTETIGRCDNGHERRRVICDLHVAGFRSMPSAIFCQQCHQAGAEVPMAVTMRRTES